MTTPLRIKSYPAQALQGEITVPGDKSISHRAVIFGSIAHGVTELSGFLAGEDCMATARAFESMGVSITHYAESRMVIQGVGMHGLKPPMHAIDCGNSGTSMRLLAGLLSAQAFNTQLIGDASLSKRPMERIKRPLIQMGADVVTTGATAPLHIMGGRALSGFQYHMPDASAQVKSGVLLAGLYADGQTSIIEQHPTRDHTERMLQTFSYPVEQAGNVITLQGKGQCQGTSLEIPGDLSSAAFFMVAACLIPGATLLIRNVGVNPTRTGIIDILTQMGANIQLNNTRLYGYEPVADVLVQYAPLHGIDIPQALVPSAIDEFPIIFIAAAHAKGRTVLRGAKELRVKESDRIAAMADGLRILGIQVETFDDGLCIEGGRLQGGTVDSRQDHRIAMAFAIAGLVATDPVYTNDSSAISTSFPTFIATAQSLTLGIEGTSL